MGMTTNSLRTGLNAVAFAVGTLAAISVPSFFAAPAVASEASTGAPSLTLPLALGALALSLLSASVQLRAQANRSSWGTNTGAPWRLAGTASGSPRGRVANSV